METNYERAARKVEFISKFYKSLLYIIIFNVSYMILNLIRNKGFFNDVSVVFLMFSLCLLVYKIVKFCIGNILITQFKDTQFGRKQYLFMTHAAIFASFLLLKVLVDINRTKITELQEARYWDYVIWFMILSAHFILVFGSEFPYFKYWEKKKINEFIKEEKVEK